jgi:hypothetical protein
MVLAKYERRRQLLQAFVVSCGVYRSSSIDGASAHRSNAARRCTCEESGYTHRRPGGPATVLAEHERRHSGHTSGARLSRPTLASLSVVTAAFAGPATGQVLLNLMRRKETERLADLPVASKQARATRGRCSTMRPRVFGTANSAHVLQDWQFPRPDPRRIPLSLDPAGS